MVIAHGNKHAVSHLSVYIYPFATGCRSGVGLGEHLTRPVGCHAQTTQLTSNAQGNDAPELVQASLAFPLLVSRWQASTPPQARLVHGAGA